MVKVINLLLRHQDSEHFENGNKHLDKLELSVVPGINEHIVIEQHLYRVVGVFHNLGYSVEILAVYEKDTIEVHKRLFNS